MEAELRKLAAELLTSKKVDVVIGYGPGALEGRVTPVFIRKPEDAGRLVWNDRCYQNLTRYLRKPEVVAMGRPGIVVKGCDMRSIVGLIVENQLKREGLFVIGVSCQGMIRIAPDGKPAGPSPKCVGCQVLAPKGCDTVVGPTEGLKSPAGTGLEDELAKLNAMTPAERWAYWKAEFDRCIRCYACRQVCPHCFCATCICEKTTPQWISPSATSAGNFAWNVFRALHLAGRCSGCQECARVCPVGIRLDLINRQLANDMKDAFGFESGADEKSPPPLACYKPNDKQEFIR